MSLILKSIEEEAEDCKKAWKGKPVGTLAVHCHHEVLAEELTELALNRIQYILTEKHMEEQALRLRLFRPVVGQAEDKYLKAHGPAWDEYLKVKGQAEDKYLKVDGPAWDEYLKVKGQAWDEYDQAHGPAWDEYLKVKGQAEDKYLKVDGQAWDEYQKVHDQAWDEYNKTLNRLHSLICKTEGCTWNGKTIFKEN